MWVPQALVNLFEINKDLVDATRDELRFVTAERDLLKVQLATTQANFSWLTSRVNQLETERAQLIKRAYGFETIVPEIARQPIMPNGFQSDLFEDLGDRAAKQLGLPVYESPFTNQSN